MVTRSLVLCSAVLCLIREICFFFGSFCRRHFARLPLLETLVGLNSQATGHSAGTAPHTGPRVCVLSGPTGAGKTTAITGIIKELIQLGLMQPDCIRSLAQGRVLVFCVVNVSERHAMYFMLKEKFAEAPGCVVSVYDWEYESETHVPVGESRLSSLIRRRGAAANPTAIHMVITCYKSIPQLVCSKLKTGAAKDQAQEGVKEAAPSSTAEFGGIASFESLDLPIDHSIALLVLTEFNRAFDFVRCALFDSDERSLIWSALRRLSGISATVLTDGCIDDRSLFTLLDLLGCGNISIHHIVYPNIESSQGPRVAVIQSSSSWLKALCSDIQDRKRVVVISDRKDFIIESMAACSSVFPWQNFVSITADSTKEDLGKLATVDALLADGVYFFMSPYVVSALDITAQIDTVHFAVFALDADHGPGMSDALQMAGRFRNAKEISLHFPNLNKAGPEKRQSLAESTVGAVTHEIMSVLASAGRPCNFCSLVSNSFQSALDIRRKNVDALFAEYTTDPGNPELTAKLSKLFDDKISALRFPLAGLDVVDAYGRYTRLPQQQQRGLLTAGQALAILVSETTGMPGLGYTYSACYCGVSRADQRPAADFGPDVTCAYCLSRAHSGPILSLGLNPIRQNPVPRPLRRIQRAFRAGYFDVPMAFTAWADSDLIGTRLSPLDVHHLYSLFDDPRSVYMKACSLTDRLQHRRRSDVRFTSRGRSLILDDAILKLAAKMKTGIFSAQDQGDRAVSWLLTAGPAELPNNPGAGRLAATKKELGYLKWIMSMFRAAGLRSVYSSSRWKELLSDLKRQLESVPMCKRFPGCRFPAKAATEADPYLGDGFWSRFDEAIGAKKGDHYIQWRQAVATLVTSSAPAALYSTGDIQGATESEIVLRHVSALSHLLDDICHECHKRAYEEQQRRARPNRKPIPSCSMVPFIMRLDGISFPKRAQLSLETAIDRSSNPQEATAALTSALCSAEQYGYKHPLIEEQPKLPTQLAIIDVVDLLKCLCLHAFGLEVRVQDSAKQGLHVRCNRAHLALRIQAYALALEYPDDRVGLGSDTAIKYDKGKYMVAFSLASQIQRLQKDSEFLLFVTAGIDAPPCCLNLIPKFVSDGPDIRNLAEVRSKTLRAMFSFAHTLRWPVAATFTAEAAATAAAGGDMYVPSPTGPWSNSNSPSLRSYRNSGFGSLPEPLRLRRTYSGISTGSRGSQEGRARVHSPAGSIDSSSTVSAVMVPASLDNYNMDSQGSQEGRPGARPWSRAVFDALKFYTRDLMKALGVTRGLAAPAMEALKRVWRSLREGDREQVLTSRKELSSDQKAALTSLVSELLERRLRELSREDSPGAAAILAALGHSDVCFLSQMLQHAEEEVFGLDDRYARARTGSVSESAARATEPEGSVRRSSRKRKRPVSATDTEFVEIEAVASGHSGSGSEGASD